jgi:cytochrome c oxidase cbb3-type subunit 3
MRPFQQRAATVPVFLVIACALLACGREPPAASSPGATSAPQPSANAKPGTPPGKAPLTEEQKLGAERYARMCSVCHGAAGEGYLADHATALGHPDFLGSVTDEFLGRAIANGRIGTTMSAWSTIRGGPLPPDEIKAIIAFLRSWEKAPRVTLDERPLSGDVARGTTLYVSECQQCHGPRGTGGTNVRIGDHDLLESASNGFLRHAIRKGRPPTPMPGYAERLGEEAVEDLVAYVRSLADSPTPYEPPRALRPPPIPLGPVPLNPKGPQPKGFKAHPDMTPADVVHAQLKRGARMSILDARASSDYAAEHIAGAVSVPFYDPAPYMSQLPKDSWLICYCGCPHAESGILCQKLRENGFTKVSILAEGLGFWKSKGYPMHSGIEPQ